MKLKYKLIYLLILKVLNAEDTKKTISVLEANKASSSKSFNSGFGAMLEYGHQSTTARLEETVPRLDTFEFNRNVTDEVCIQERKTPIQEHKDSNLLSAYKRSLKIKESEYSSFDIFEEPRIGIYCEKFKFPINKAVAKTRIFINIDSKVKNLDGQYIDDSTQG